MFVISAPSELYICCTCNLASSDVDTCVEAGRLLVADLYDSKGSAKSVHRDLNKLKCLSFQLQVSYIFAALVENRLTSV
jgi:hypothetical protein